MAKSKNSPSEKGKKIAAVNKKARRDYEILSTWEAGVHLLGSEVKSIREGSVNLKESYVRMLRGEMFLVGCHISPTHTRLWMAMSHLGTESFYSTRERLKLFQEAPRRKV